MAKPIAVKIKDTLNLLGLLWITVKENLPGWRTWFLPRPRTVKGAVRYLLLGLDKKNRAALKAMPRDELIRLHHGFGTGIRNDLGLWGQNRALMNDPELRGKHPDDMSMILIEKLWDHLHAQDGHSPE